MQGVLCEGNDEISVTVKTLPDGSIEFIPSSMSDYSITFGEDSTVVKFGELSLDADFSLSRFSTVSEMFFDMKKADFTAYSKSVKNGFYKISSNGTTLLFSKKALLPERLEKDGTVFIFKDFS